MADPNQQAQNQASAEAKQLAADLANELSGILSVNRDITAEIGRQVTATANLKGATDSEVSLVKKLYAESKDVANTITRQISLLEGVNKGLAKSIDLKGEIKKNEQKIIELNITRGQMSIDLEKAQLDLVEKQNAEEEAQLNLIAARNSGSGRLVQQAQVMLAKARDAHDIEKDRTAQLQENIRTADDLIMNYEEGNDELRKGLKLLQQQEEQAKKLRDRIKEQLMGTLTFGLSLRAIWQTFVALNKQATETSQQLGIGENQALKLTRSTSLVASNFSKSTFAVSTLLKGLQELNAELGTSYTLSSQDVVQFTELTKIMGLTAKEAANIFTLSKLNNQTLGQTEQSIVDGVVAYNKQFRVQISAKTVLKDISDLSAGILVKFKQNPEALGKAVSQARALGMTLDQVDKTADSLLNFESSIESELEAELLTGKAINLERARAAALTGDQATLMNEIASQTGNLAGFQKMNVIQQGSMAKAFGLSRDELSKMLMDQERFSKLGDVADKSAAEQLKYAQEHGVTLEKSVLMSLQQQAAGEKFNEAVSKLKEIMVSVVDGPLGQMVQGFASLVDSAGGLATLIGVVMVGGILKLLSTAAQILPLFKAMRAAKVGEAVASGWEAAMSGPQSMLTGGVLGLIAGAGITAAIMAATNVEDASLNSSGFLIKTPKNQLIKSHPQDKMVLAPNADQLLAQNNNGGGGNNNNDVIAAINKLNERPVMVVAKYNTDTVQRLSTQQNLSGNSGVFA